MRSAWSLPVAFLALCIFAAEGLTQEKEVTLKGTILCTRCALKETAKCGNAIVVKDGAKEVTYYFKDKGNKESYHEEVCGGAKKQGTVTGTVSEKDGKKWITPTKVKYASSSAYNHRAHDAEARVAASCCNVTVRAVRTCCCCCRGG
jgi:hypothetical protein